MNVIHQTSGSIPVIGSCESTVPAKNVEKSFSILIPDDLRQKSEDKPLQQYKIEKNPVDQILAECVGHIHGAISRVHHFLGLPKEKQTTLKVLVTGVSILGIAAGATIAIAGLALVFMTGAAVWQLALPIGIGAAMGYVSHQAFSRGLKRYLESAELSDSTLKIAEQIPVVKPVEVTEEKTASTIVAGETGGSAEASEAENSSSEGTAPDVASDRPNTPEDIVEVEKAAPENRTEESRGSERVIDLQRINQIISECKEALRDVKSSIGNDLNEASCSPQGKIHRQQIEDFERLCENPSEFAALYCALCEYYTKIGGDYMTRFHIWLKDIRVEHNRHSLESVVQVLLNDPIRWNALSDVTKDQIVTLLSHLQNSAVIWELSELEQLAPWVHQF